MRVNIDKFWIAPGRDDGRALVMYVEDAEQNKEGYYLTFRTIEDLVKVVSALNTATSERVLFDLKYGSPTRHPALEQITTSAEASDVANDSGCDDLVRIENLTLEEIRRLILLANEVEDLHERTLDNCAGEPEKEMFELRFLLNKAGLESSVGYIDPCLDDWES